LLSRFKWGLSADLQQPGLETRIAILQKKMYAEGIDLPKEVVEYLAYSITTNIRELEGAMISLIAQSSLNKKAVNAGSREADDRQVREEHGKGGVDRLHPESGVRLLRPADRTAEEQDPQARSGASTPDRDVLRQAMTKSSLASIGAHCGGKDHATVLHACRTVNNLQETDKQFRGYLEDSGKEVEHPLSAFPTSEKAPDRSGAFSFRIFAAA
jgi:chromosomal replication initiator protein